MSEGTIAGTRVSAVTVTGGDGGELLLSGTGPRPEHVTLSGPRAAVHARLTGRGKTWKARIPLRVSRWGAAALPLPSGSYDLSIVDESGATVSQQLTMPAVALAMLTVHLDGGRVVVRAPADFLPTVALRSDGEPENAVFFESFYGRNASCNPLAIDRELARVCPEIPRYWSVTDLSVIVPEGATAVVEGSEAWLSARRNARLLVVNDWLRHGFTARRGQHVLQTWHGTPLKRLAIHRPGFNPRRIAASVRQSRGWDALLAQNSYSEGVLRKAYAYFGRPIWVEGYPRNDILRRGDAAAVRARLGIGAAERVVLYAPTWRDDRETIVDFVDPVLLAEQTGAVVLVRGHARTLGPGADLQGPRVIDVTTFPDMAELLLVADDLVTDYSSAMFDFSVTGKPMYFFVPDLEHYRGVLRGFYFDLLQQAPGPVVRTQDELVKALGADRTKFDERYRVWQRRFNPRDDGHAAERIVARILDQRWLDR